MPTDVTMMVEEAKAVAETAAPAVTTGTIDWKKVAFVAGGVLVLAGAAYCTKKAVDKRKAKKAVLDSAVKEEVPVANVIPEEA